MGSQQIRSAGWGWAFLALALALEPSGARAQQEPDRAQGDLRLSCEVVVRDLQPSRGARAVYRERLEHSTADGTQVSCVNFFSDEGPSQTGFVASLEDKQEQLGAGRFKPHRLRNIAGQPPVRMRVDRARPYDDRKLGLSVCLSSGAPQNAQGQMIAGQRPVTMAGVRAERYVYFDFDSREDFEAAREELPGYQVDSRRYGLQGFYLASFSEPKLTPDQVLGSASHPSYRFNWKLFPQAGRPTATVQMTCVAR